MLMTICIPLWNRGSDMCKLLENIEILYKKLDTNILDLNVSIGDFNSDDVNLKEEIKKYSFKTTIVYIEGPFNITVGITKAVETVKDGILLITDADTVFDVNINLHSLHGHAKEGEKYLSPICSSEAEPSDALWKSVYNPIKKIYVPNHDHNGAGLVVCYLSDWKNANVFIGSGFLEERGKYWGYHDDVMRRDLGKNLSRTRFITDEIWTRPNSRSAGNWYSTGGSGLYKPTNIEIYKSLDKKLIFKLSQIGYALSSDIAFTNRIKSNQDINLVNELKHGDTIYISPGETSIDYNQLVSILISKKILVYFFLIGEPIVDGKIVVLLIPFAIKMFIQNNVYNHPNIHNLPIGIRDCGEIVEMHKGFTQSSLFEEGKRTVDKEYLCLLCFSNAENRRDCYDTLNNKNFVLNLNELTPIKQIPYLYGIVPININYEYTHKSIYILSPGGTGQATHRFFEAIYLDAIPIVQRTNTSFDKLYEVFPCLIVNKWNEVAEELLLKNKNECIKKMSDFKSKYPDLYTNPTAIKDILAFC